MISVSTKFGDKGETSLANGKRVAKSSLVFECIGTLDELNSHLGLVIANLTENHKYLDTLFQIQNDLFIIGGEIAQSAKSKLKQKSLEQLEKVSEEIQQSMEGNWHTKFLLPGGSKEGALLDIARSVSRRLERTLWRYNLESEVSADILAYANRLSDFLYVLRCLVNQETGVKDKQFNLD